MAPPKKLHQAAASEFLEQLHSDPFIQLLARTTLFHQIPPTQLPLPLLQHICAVVKIVSLPKNKPLDIERVDKEKMALYEILSGYVKIYDREEKKSDQRRSLIQNPPALLAWRVPGELLGDFQFALPEEKLTDHMVATDNCRLLKIPSSTIRQLAQTYPQLYLNLASNLATKANKARIRAQILRLPNIECMVAKLFLELLKERKFDGDIPQRNVINGTFRIHDIAAFLGYEYHSTQLGIHNLINDKLIDHYQNQKSGRFALCDQKGLHTFLERELAKLAEQRKQKGRRRAGNVNIAPASIVRRRP
jgi:CRP-like cAMP-binding protein